MQRSRTRARAAAAGLGLAVVVVVVAIAARAPLSGATPVNARSAQAPTTALFMVLLGTGVVMLGALVLVVWPGRRRKDDPPEQEPTRIEVPWIWKLVAIVLPVALGAALVAAAVSGTRSAHTAPGFGGESFGGASAGTNHSSGAGGGFTVPAWLPWTVLAIVGIALAAGVVVLWLRRERTATEPPETSAARAAVEAAIGALDTETDPRRAVIAAYGAMQRELGEHGVARSPAEAPREYLQRTLTASRATEREARTLTGLFEEARYSTHPIPERLREAALSALRSLQRRLQAGGAQ
jgi:cytochrome b561